MISIVLFYCPILFPLLKRDIELLQKDYDMIYEQNLSKMNETIDAVAYLWYFRKKWTINAFTIL